ncbi:MAG: transposase family protein [Armatimonadetes bacterium]|nr:transposase family protein [Armatimonadota bacterium]
MDCGWDWRLNGTKLKLLVVKDEFTREWLHVEVATSLTSAKLVKILTSLFDAYGEPEFLRSDNGPEFLSRVLAVWLSTTKARSRFIKPGSPWQNGHAESLMSRLRAEILDVEVFYNLADAQVKLSLFRKFYNEERPNSAIGYLTRSGYALPALRTCNDEGIMRECEVMNGPQKGGRAPQFPPRRRPIWRESRSRFPK